jgi:hypothetical protein
LGDGAFASLAAQASITLINNKGDVGKTLKEVWLNPPSDMRVLSWVEIMKVS